MEQKQQTEQQVTQEQTPDEKTGRIPESPRGMAKLAVLLLVGQMLLTVIGIAAAAVVGILIWKTVQG